MTCANTANASSNKGTDFTSKILMEKMEPMERFHYVSGMIEGMAYSRFAKDSAGGQKDERGMVCIRNWFHEGGDNRSYRFLEKAFRKYGDYPPAVVIYTIIKKKCGT